MSEQFGARLKQLRKRVGVTQQALAQGAKLSVSAVARLEQGGNPSSKTVAALAHALAVPIGVFNTLIEEEPVGDSQ